jgi:hypothetical protein
MLLVLYWRGANKACLIRWFYSLFDKYGYILSKMLNIDGKIQISKHYAFDENPEFANLPASRFFFL